MCDIEIANINEFKNDSSKIIVYDGIAIVVFKKGNEFFAIDNRCPHRGASLGDGSIVGDIVTCPWHAWQFSISTGQALKNPNCFIKTFKVFIENDIIKIKYDKKN